MATSPTPTPRRLTPTRSDVNRGPKTEPRNLQPYPNRTVHRPGQESVTHHASSQLSRTQTAHPIEFGIATETTRADVRAPDASTLRPPGCALWVETLDVEIKPLQHHSRARARSLEMHPRAALFRLPAGAAQTTSASASASSATAAFDATYPAMPAFA